jgi:hypothetical protein
MLEVITKPFELAYELFKTGQSGAKWLKRLKRRPAYGSAAWAKAQDLNTSPTGFVLGQLASWKYRTTTVFADPESCIIMVGQRGAGKSLTMTSNPRTRLLSTPPMSEVPGQSCRALPDFDPTRRAIFCRKWK